MIAFEGGFHGRTLLALTMTARAHPYKTGLGPFAPEVYRVQFPNAYRGPTASVALEELEEVLVNDVAPEEVAAIVFEPQQGEGGFVPAPREFAEGLRAICDREGIVLVADEVQTGFGRTGRMFAMEHFSVEPDLIVVAKSIAAGLPLSGVIGRAGIMDAGHRGAVGGTYIGNPVALAAALAVLDVFAEEDLVARAVTLGETIRSRMLDWQRRHTQIGDVRGLGAMLAIELVEDPISKEPAPELASAVIDAALQRGLILLKAGVHGNCIRVLCPLTIGDGRARRGAGCLGRGALVRARLNEARFILKRLPELEAAAALVALERELDQPVEKPCVRPARRLEQPGVEARRGEARDRVQLVHHDLPVGLADEEIGASHALAIGCHEGLNGKLLRPLDLRLRAGPAEGRSTRIRPRRTSTRSRTSLRSARRPGREATRPALAGSRARPTSTSIPGTNSSTSTFSS